MQAKPLLLGHRGARSTKSIPENSVESFDLCLAHGCDGFEFDVQVTADRETVIAHDPSIGGIEIAKAPSASLAGLPRLRDVLAQYQQSAFLDIELKVPGTEKITAALLREHAPARGVVVSSFLPEVLRTLAEIDPSVPLGYICDDKSRLDLWRELPVEYIIPQQRLATRRLIEQAHGEGKKILVWTVNGAADMKKFAAWGVEAIISDDTAKLVRTLKSASKK